MVAAKSVLRSMVFAALACSGANAAPMLTLATTSMSSTGQSSLSYAPRYNMVGLNLSLGSANGANSNQYPVSMSAPVQAPPPSSTFKMMAAPVQIQTAAPVQIQTAAPAPAPAPMMARQVAVAAAPMGQATADAFLNMGPGPFAAASAVTAGGGQVWWNSPQVNNLFGGSLNDQTRGMFIQMIRDRVQQTFNQSGVPVNITTNPGTPASHSISVVSGTFSPLLPAAIGMTQIGGDGFTFIDQAAKAASNVDQLAWIVAHNVAHEMMLAFGVPEVHDATGNYIDARNANWAMMTDPNAVFSPSAANDLLSRDFNARAPGIGIMAQVIEPATVPEPATIALWGFAAGGVVLIRTRKTRARRPA